jgi:deoxyinosine 3'endonuclease (endonuclease V)
MWCRGCGTACHVALATGLPTLGVAKNLHLMEELGLGREEVKGAFRYETIMLRRIGFAESYKLYLSLISPEASSRQGSTCP